MRRGVLTLLALAALGGALGPVPARADDLPPRNQALLLLRVLAYDRNLAARAGAVVTVVILYRAGDRASEERRSALAAAFEDVAHDVVVAGLPVRVEALGYHDAAELEARLEATRAALIYVDGALLRAVPEIVQTTHRHGVLSADGSRALVESGVSIGVVAQAKRAGLIVNLKAARAEGADLDAALLSVAEVLRD